MKSFAFDDTQNVLEEVYLCDLIGDVELDDSDWRIELLLRSQALRNAGFILTLHDVGSQMSLGFTHQENQNHIPDGFRGWQGGSNAHGQNSESAVLCNFTFATPLDKYTAPVFFTESADEVHDYLRREESLILRLIDFLIHGAESNGCDYNEMMTPREDGDGSELFVLAFKVLSSLDENDNQGVEKSSPVKPEKFVSLVDEVNHLIHHHGIDDTKELWGSERLELDVIHHNAHREKNTFTVDGVTVWMRSDATTDCVCCDGPHIYGRRIDLIDSLDAHLPSGFFNSLDVWIHDQVRKIPDGARVRLSIEVIEE